MLVLVRSYCTVPWTVVSKVEKFVFGLAGAMAVDEARLRASLREVFARLDIDGSGAVSTREMRRMTDELGMEMSDEALVQMMVDADPDGSGEIDFDELVWATRTQIEAGHGGKLASVVQQAGSFFGLFGSLLSIFGRSSEPPEPQLGSWRGTTPPRRPCRCQSRWSCPRSLRARCCP